MQIKLYFANMRIADKFALGKNAAKMFVLMDSFRTSKKVTWDFSYILEVLQAHSKYSNQSINQYIIEIR